MSNLDYKKIREDFIKTTKEIKEESVTKGFSIELFGTLSKALSLQIEKEAARVSTPGYKLFTEGEEEFEEKPLEAPAEKKEEKKTAKTEKVVEEKVEKAEEQEEEVVVEEIVPEEKAQVAKKETLDDGKDLVYASKNGTKYHTADCMYRKESFKGMTLEEAKKAGKQACSACFAK